MTCDHCQQAPLIRTPYHEGAITQYRAECPVCGRGHWEFPGEATRPRIPNRVRRYYIP